MIGRDGSGRATRATAGTWFTPHTTTGADRVPLIVKPAGGERGERCPIVVSTLVLDATPLEMTGADASDDPEWESESFTPCRPIPGTAGRAFSVIGPDPDPAPTQRRQPPAQAGLQRSASPGQSTESTSTPPHR